MGWGAYIVDPSFAFFRERSSSEREDRVVELEVVREETEEIDEPGKSAMFDCAKKGGLQFSDSLEIDRAPLLPQRLNIIKEIDISSVQHDLILAEWSERCDALQVGEDRRLLDMYKVVEHHQGDTICVDQQGR